MMSKYNINYPKICTDYEQSKMLSEHLSEKTADMSWTCIFDEDHMMSDFKMDLVPASLNPYRHVPAWSLACLVSLLRDNGFVTTFRKDGSACCSKLGEDFVYRNETSTPMEFVDSVFGLVLRLLQKKLLITTK